MKPQKKSSLSKEQANSLWKGVVESDFINEDNIEDKEIGEYDKENMTLFAANTNLFRMLVRLSDSLKPVERRVLYSLYKLNAKPGNKTKSAIIVANTMKYHPHGDSVCYNAMVGLAQPWKKQVPLVDGKGNYGNAGNPDMFAHYRYTEAYMSKYAWECFFEDFDDDCVETLFNSASDSEEPMSLPSKFPNILVNGGMGIAFGNSFRIPPYNIDDIISKCTLILKNPDATDVFMVPDFPCDCDIVDNGDELHNIIDHGIGTLKMRGRIEIEQSGRNWILRILSVPWMVNFQSVMDKIRDLAKSGVLSIKEIQNANYNIKMKDGTIQTQIDTRIFISDSHDPHAIMNKLYSMTELEKTVSINFKVVTDNLEVARLNMKDLILSWIDERRSYKRRVYNKKLTRITARMELLDILIYLLQKDNIEKTIKVIKNSNSNEVERNLQKLCSMTSYQARRIAEMRLSAFTKDARKRYQEELTKLTKDRQEVLDLVTSEKKIDKIILDELMDLKKYASPRRTEVIEPESGARIAKTEHNLIVTKNGYIKKLAYNGNYKVNMGAFKTGDYPISRLIVSNLDNVIFFDSFGRYSIIPVHTIDNNDPSQYGSTLFDITKLAGKIVAVEQYIGEDALDTLKKATKNIPYLITATNRGYIKKTPLVTYLDIRTTKNVRCMKIRDDDSLVYAGIIIGNSNIMVYTKNGNYVYLNVDTISEQNKDAMGLLSIKMDVDDQLIGITVIGKDDQYIGVVTNKGIAKRCELQYFGTPKNRSAATSASYLTTLEVADSVNAVIGLRENSGIAVCTRTDVYQKTAEEIPVMSRKAKGKKLIPVSLGVNILNVFEVPLAKEEKLKDEEIITTSKPKKKTNKKKKKK